MKRLLFGCRLLLAVCAGVAGAPAARVDAVNPRVPVRSSLAVTANVYFGGGDEETYFIETEFYLLDRSLVEILRSAGLKPEFPDNTEEKRLLTDEDYLEAAAKALTVEDDEEAALIAFLINDRLAKHRRAVAQTDLLGRGKFQAVRTGDYYLFGIGRTDDEIFVWHMPVQIRAGGNRVEVDQTNAAVIFSTDE